MKKSRTIAGLIAVVLAVFVFGCNDGGKKKTSSSKKEVPTEPVSLPYPPS